MERKCSEARCLESEKITLPMFMIAMQTQKIEGVKKMCIHRSRVDESIDYAERAYRSYKYRARREYRIYLKLSDEKR
jgi:hypothetical protein